MSTEFNKNCYYSTFAQSKPLVIDNLRFHYGAASYREFSHLYDVRNESAYHIARKIIALPGAVLAIAKIVYHIAVFVFAGIPKALFGNGTSLKSATFCLVRDFHELFGRILSLFHDKAGLYHVQAAQCQKTCYAIALEETEILNEANKKYDNSNDFYGPFHAIQKITYNVQGKEAFLLKLANRHFDAGNAENNLSNLIALDDLPPLDALKEISHDYKNAEALMLKFANKRFEERAFYRAGRIAMGITHDIETKEAFLLKLANQYFEEGVFNRDQEAFKVLREITSDSKSKDALLLKNANRYFEKGDFEGAYQAFYVLKEMTHDHDNKETFLLKIANRHFEAFNFAAESALDALKEISHDYKSKETFLLKLANKCFERGDYHLSRSTVAIIIHDTESKNAFLEKLDKKITQNEENKKAFIDAAKKYLVATEDI